MFRVTRKFQKKKKRSVKSKFVGGQENNGTTPLEKLDEDKHNNLKLLINAPNLNIDEFKSFCNVEIKQSQLDIIKSLSEDNIKLDEHDKTIDLRFIASLSEISTKHAISLKEHHTALKRERDEAIDEINKLNEKGICYYSKTDNGNFCTKIIESSSLKLAAEHKIKELRNERQIDNLGNIWDFQDQIKKYVFCKKTLDWICKDTPECKLNGDLKLGADKDADKFLDECKNYIAQKVSLGIRGLFETNESYIRSRFRIQTFAFNETAFKKMETKMKEGIKISIDTDTDIENYSGDQTQKIRDYILGDGSDNNKGLTDGVLSDEASGNKGDYQNKLFKLDSNESDSLKKLVEDLANNLKISAKGIDFFSTLENSYWYNYNTLEDKSEPDKTFTDWNGEVANAYSNLFFGKKGGKSKTKKRKSKIKKSSQR